MRRTWASVASLVALLLAVAGCYSTNQQHIKPPKHDEVYALPPEGDTRFDNPVAYPKGTLNQDGVKPKDDGKGGPGGPGGAGGPGGGGGAPRFGGGMGGGGGGY